MKIVAVLLLTGCGTAPLNPACSTDQLNAIERAYTDEVMQKCGPYKTRATCPDYPAIDEKYAEERQAWVRCR